MTDSPRLIGLYSPAPQSGKSTIANYLRSRNYAQVSFAAPLKRLVSALLIELGFTSEAAQHFVHEEKEAPLPGINTTARHMLQTLGTEYGRDCIHPNLWVMCAERRILDYVEQGMNVVVDDCRFPNEANLIRELGGELWHVHRPDAKLTTTHTSEGGLDNYPLFDRRIENDGTLLSLYSTIREILENNGKNHRTSRLRPLSAAARRTGH